MTPLPSDLACWAEFFLGIPEPYPFTVHRFLTHHLGHGQIYHVIAAQRGPHLYDAGGSCYDRNRPVPIGNVATKETP